MVKTKTAAYFFCGNFFSDYFMYSKVKKLFCNIVFTVIFINVILISLLEKNILTPIFLTAHTQFFGVVEVLYSTAIQITC